MNILRRILALFWTFTVTVAASSQTIPVGKGPDELFLTPNEHFLYVANVKDTFISIIDTRTDKAVQTIDGTDYPWGFTRLGETNLVVVSGWDKDVDVIDFTTHKIVRSKRYEQNLGGIASTKDGKILFVIATDDNKVFKIDSESLGILDEYATGNGPEEAVLSKSGETLYVVNFNSSKVFTYNADTYEKLSAEYIVGNKPIGIVSAITDTKLFISNYGDNSITVVSLH